MLRNGSAKLQKGAMFDWNDLRYLLAVAESGSTLAAARALSVSQTTAARRVAALEQAIGVKLFERRASGYVVTPAGEELLGLARAVEAAAGALEAAAAAQSRDVSGTVRLTSEEVFAVTILAPILRDLHDAYPRIMIELDSSGEIRDLGAGEAEVALRSTEALTGGGVVGRRISDDNWTLYCSRDYAARAGIPRSVEQLREHVLIGGGGGTLWRVYGAWLHARGLDQAVAIHQSSATGMLSAVRAGFGVAALPCLVADLEPDLIRCVPPSASGRSLWLVTSERLRHTPRIRAVIDFLAERLVVCVRDAQKAARDAAG